MNYDGDQPAGSPFTTQGTRAENSIAATCLPKEAGGRGKDGWNQYWKSPAYTNLSPGSINSPSRRTDFVIKWPHLVINFPFLVRINSQVIEKGAIGLRVNVGSLNRKVPAVNKATTFSAARWERSVCRYSRLAIIANKLVAEAKLFHK